MKRVFTGKNKLDKRFHCPYCKEDLREKGIRYTKHRIEYTNCDMTAYYDDEGSQANTEYGDSETNDSEENGYGDYYYCGNCEHELSVNSDIIEELDLTEAWK